MKRAVIAMSGGVDSAAAAVMAKEAGYETVGVTLRMREPSPETERVFDEIVSKLGIPLHVLDREKGFKERVLLPAAREYACGRTPNPCCECNREFKFAELLAFARGVEADELWTGHYAVVDPLPDRPVLRRGADPAKDQSYFLYRLTPEMLRTIRFPLGKLTKAEVRAFAASRGFAFSKRPDSQDICFAEPGVCCGETLRRAAGLPERPGRFVFEGKTVGRHTGTHRFTIGQRNGYGVALGRPAYIARIDAASGDIELVTDREKLACSIFRLERTNLLTAALPREGLAIQIRYRSRPVSCRVETLPDGTWRVETAEPQYAVTPGQAGVLYRGDQVAGGGVICL